MYLTLGLKTSEMGGRYSTPSVSTALIEYLSNGGKFVFSNNKLVNQGEGGATYDAQPKTGRALQLGATNELPINTFVGGYITYNNISTNTIVQEATNGTPKNFLNVTVNNILTTHTAFSASDLTKLQDNPNLLAKLSMNGSAAELDMVLVGDEGWYACAEEGGTLVFDAKSKSNGSFYFKSSKSTNQTYTLKMPVGTTVTLNGTVYNGNGNTNVTATTAWKGIKFTESVDGALTYFSCLENQLKGSIPDLSANPNLTIFHCNYNSLTGSIPSLSNNTALTQFYCIYNQLTGSIPNLSSNTQLTSFLCNNNQLTGYAGGNIKVTSYFNASSNKLTVAAVDAILQGLVDGGTTGAVTINLGGGTNGIPTNTAAIDTLRARGCTVTVKT